MTHFIDSYMCININNPNIVKDEGDLCNMYFFMTSK